MPAAARRKAITTLVAGLLIVSACKHDEPAPPPAPAKPAPPPPAPVDAGSSGIKITFTEAKPRVPGAGLAKRCTLGGDPLPADCVGGNEGLAFDKAGTLYVMAKDGVRRYKRVTGDEPCRFDPAGAPIALPPENKRPQTLGKGPLYMRSGGPAWHVAAAGDAVYIVDFLGGMFRVDRGKAEPACTDEFGYERVAMFGKRLVIARKGIEQLALSSGGHCKASSAHLDDKAHGNVFVVRDHVYAGFVDVSRYDGTTKVPAAGDAHVCSITAVTACGDGTCLVDNNCMKVLQLGADGKLARTFDDTKLFDTRPYALASAVTHDDVYLLAHHRDHDACETAIYMVPSAAFTTD